MIDISMLVVFQDMVDKLNLVHLPNHMEYDEDWLLEFIEYEYPGIPILINPRHDSVI